MKKIILCSLVALAAQVFAQEKQSVQLQATAAKRMVIEAPAGLPDGTTKMVLPPTNAQGYLQNDGSGNLSWQTSVQASRAGIGSWYKNNYGTGNQIIDVAGTDVPTIVPPFPGSLTGVSMKINPGGTGGTLVATVRKNGVPTTLTVTINNVGQSFAFTDATGSAISFNAGDEIGVEVNDPGGFAPNTDIVVTIFANF